MQFSAMAIDCRNSIRLNTVGINRIRRSNIIAKRRSPHENSTFVHHPRPWSEHASAALNLSAKRDVTPAAHSGRKETETAKKFGNVLLRKEFETARRVMAAAEIAGDVLRFQEAAQHVRTLRAVSEVMLDLLDSIADSGDSRQGDSDDG